MLRIKIKPPTHRVDGGGVAISYADCWDWDRIQRELAELELQALQAAVDKALEGKPEEDAETIRASVVLSDEEKEAAKDRHPVRRYLQGKTRLQPDAPDHGTDGKPTTARAYLLDTPTEFVVRRLPWQEYQRCQEINNTRDRLVEFLRRGLVEIRSPGGLTWKRKDEDPEDSILQAVHEAGPHLLTEIGSMVVGYNRPLDDEEGKPYGFGATGTNPKP